jgi:hypothetical protein
MTAIDERSMPPSTGAEVPAELSPTTRLSTSSRAAASVMPTSAPIAVALLLYTMVRAGRSPPATLVKTVRQVAPKRTQPEALQALVAGGIRVALSKTGEARLDSSVALLDTEPTGTARTWPLMYGNVQACAWASVAPADRVGALGAGTTTS